MSYNIPVIYLYGCGKEDSVYSIREFKDQVEEGCLIDYDGFGHPVKDTMADVSISIVPSRLDEIPDDATHIVWFNR